jgi:hypothetical protein
MAVRTITYFSTLMQLAKRAAETKDPKDIAKHKEYEALCLEADEMVIGKAGDLI